MTAQPLATAPYGTPQALPGLETYYDSPQPPLRRSSASPGDVDSRGRIRLEDGTWATPKRIRTLARRRRKITPRIYAPRDPELDAAVRQVMDMLKVSEPKAAAHLMRMGAR